MTNINVSGSLHSLTFKIILFFKINLFCFIYFIFGCVGSSLLHRGFSLVEESRGYSSLQCAGYSLWWPLLLWSMGSRYAGFSSCGMLAQQLWLAGSRAQAQQSWHTGSVALQHVEIPSHCVTREALRSFLINLMHHLLLIIYVFIYIYIHTYMYTEREREQLVSKVENIDFINSCHNSEYYVTFSISK